MGEVPLIQKLMNKYQYIAVFLTTIISNIQESLYIFVRNKSFGQLLDISQKNFIFLKTLTSEFSYIKVWFTDEISKPLETQYKINITLVIV